MNAILDHFDLVLGLFVFLLGGLSLLGFYLVRRTVRSRSRGEIGAPRALVLGVLGGLLGVVGSMGCFLAIQGIAAVGPAQWAMRDLVGEAAPDLEWQVVHMPSAVAGTPASGTTAGEAVPVEAQASSGERATLAELRGNVVLVNYWATWCPPCRKEMPDLDRLQKDLGEQGLVVVHISDEDEETVSSYLETAPMTTRHGRAKPFPWPEGGRPTTYVVDRQGVVRSAFLGARDYGRFRELVEPLLADG